jgi:alpha-galactosidase
MTDGPGFRVELDGRRLAGGVLVDSGERTAGGRVERHSTWRYADDRVTVTHHEVGYDGTELAESWVSVECGSGSVELTRVDSVVLELPDTGCELSWWTSSWGREFEPVRSLVTDTVVVESTAGRSSHGDHPYAVLTRSDGRLLALSVMWSGNWVLRFDASGAGTVVSGGLHAAGFATTLSPGRSFESPHVVHCGGRDLDHLAGQFATVGRRYWYPHNETAARLPVEWNHWWSYEDDDIDEKTFRQNVDVAQRIGVELCTLDAGWFGPSDKDTNWVDHRGDWDLVNTERFPDGIRALADHTHAAGMLFGIWCEIEAMGPRAVTARRRPELVATRDGEPLGYVCLGNPAAREWAYDTLDRLVTEYTADWIKLDFNLDPGLGCDRTDHGHGPGDGLYEHYRGYYATLDRFRSAHPAVVLENCSSGGLRLDLEMLRHTDVTFLSDPDWPEHGLQLLWGATAMFAPDRLLHWGYSEWRVADHPHQKLDLRDPELTPHQLAYYRRIAMLGATGCSFRLPGLPDQVEQSLREHNEFYRDVARPFVRHGLVRRLTGQPRREGAGESWAAFQYSLPDEDRHLVFVFRLDGGEPSRALRLRGLADGETYRVRRVDAGTATDHDGADLAGPGLVFDTLPEEGSEILMVERRA